MNSKEELQNYFKEKYGLDINVIDYWSADSEPAKFKKIPFEEIKKLYPRKKNV